MKGKNAHEKDKSGEAPAIVTHQILYQKGLPSGLYIIKAGNTLYITQKIVIK